MNKSEELKYIDMAISKKMEDLEDHIWLNTTPEPEWVREIRLEIEKHIEDLIEKRQEVLNSN